VDAETGEVNDRSAGVQINETISVAPGASVSVGWAPDVMDANGNKLTETSAIGQTLRLRPGHQVALLDIGGAVVDTISL
jgi:hypothetical protein